MPLVEPARGRVLREKVLLIAEGKHGKSTCHLSVAYWAFKSGDARTFYIFDTEQAIEAVLAEEKYDGMLRSVDGEVINPDGNIVLFNVIDWDEYMSAQGVVMKEAGLGDWIVIDMVSHAWPAVQSYYLAQVVKKTRGESLLDAAKKGATGWDLFKADYDWTTINGLYADWLTPMLVRSRAHIFMVAEQDEIRESSKMTEDQKEHMKSFGRYKAAGQKKLPFQCRSYLRLQRLARGRVLYTLGDRARTELSGADMNPDFFTCYLKNVAGWSIGKAEKADKGEKVEASSNA